EIFTHRSACFFQFTFADLQEGAGVPGTPVALSTPYPVGQHPHMAGRKSGRGGDWKTGPGDRRLRPRGGCPVSRLPGPHPPEASRGRRVDVADVGEDGEFEPPVLVDLGSPAHPAAADVEGVRDDLRSFAPAPARVAGPSTPRPPCL